MVQLIAATTTRAGLYSELDQNHYPKGVIVSDTEIAMINISSATSTAIGITQSHPGEIVPLFSDGP
jgi:hypothetical protein